MLDTPESGTSNITRRQLLLALGALVGSTRIPGAHAAPAPLWPLWVVEGKGSKVYLMGETPPRVTAWHDARIEELVATCAALWTETNHKHREDPKQLVGRYGIAMGKPLAENLNAHDRERLKRAADISKVPLDSLAQYRPWLAAMTLEQSYYGTLKLDEGGTAENVLIAKAAAANVALSSEFAAQDDVVAWLGSMSPEQDAQFLAYTLDQILSGPEANERIYAAWSRGDDRGATAVVDRIRQEQPAFYAMGVVERNRNWIPRIDTMLTNAKPSLIVLGLYHLVGPDSVLAQLRARGMNVRAV